MKTENNLYETVYQSMLTQLYSGVLRCGQSIPSQQELCRQYNIGITTVRKVLGMLEIDGFIRTSAGKRAVVCFDENKQSYISVLLKRSESILDIYRGLEILMPPLYAAGAVRCPDYSRLDSLTIAAARETDLNTFYLQSSRFFTEFLKPFRNPVILDLQSDMEHYARIPYLSASGLANPFTITCTYARTNLQYIRSLAGDGQEAALTGRLRRMYREMGARIASYLEALGKKYPADPGQDSYQWFSGKSRVPLYTVVARDLFKRCEMGEFDNCTYLPSVPLIMEEYHISKSTASNAVSLLSDIGFVRTLDKKGIVRRNGGGLQPIRLDEKIIAEHLVLFLDVLQILSVCADSLSSAAFSALSRPEKEETARLWAGYQNTASTAQIVQILLHFLQENMPSKCLRSILEQFDNILIWGHYMDRMHACNAITRHLDSEIRRGFSQLQTALSEDKEDEFTRPFSSIFALVYQSPRSQLLPCVPWPERLPAPLCGRLYQPLP